MDVRLVYDDIGSIWNLPPRFLKTLKQAGIKGKVFNPLAALPSFIFNNRNHRKIVVIDGEIAYTGGTNLADEYVNLIERFGHWKDAAIRLEGPAVWSFTVMFLSLWNHLCRHDVHREDQFQTYAPSDLRNHLTSNEDEAAGMQSADQGYLIPYDDIPDDNKSVGVDTYHTMIQQAEHSIFIMTPYLVIDDEMIRSLTLAAAGGVEVIIITPHIPDKPYVLETTRSYYSKLIEHGVRIFEYTPGFIHSKVVLVDDCLAVVGTINFDYRSFYLHLECAVWMYQTECIPDIRRILTKPSPSPKKSPRRTSNTASRSGSCRPSCACLPLNVRSAERSLAHHLKNDIAGAIPGVTLDQSKILPGPDGDFSVRKGNGNKR